MSAIARWRGRLGRAYKVSALPAILGAALLALAAEGIGLSEGLARVVYDGQLRARSPSPWPTDFVVAPIDESVTRALGRWPWPRARSAEALRRLRELGAKTVVADIFFIAPDDAAQDALLAEALQGAVLAIPSRDASPSSPSLAGIEDDLLQIPSSTFPWKPPLRVTPPLDAFARTASRLAHSQLYLQGDGLVRTHSPVLPVEGAARLLPSLALAAVMEHRDIPAADVAFDGRALVLGGTQSFRLHAGEMLMDFAPASDGAPGAPGGPQRIGLDALFDPAQEESVRQALTGKLVLVYVEAGSDDREATPISRETSGGLVHAYAIRTLLTGRAPHAAPLLPAFALLALLVLGLSPWLVDRSFTTVLTAFCGLIAGYLLVGIGFVRAWDLFLPAATPLPFLAFAGLLLAGRAHYGLRRDHHRNAARLSSAPASGDADVAPRERVCVIFTDIEGSTSLWQNAYPAMREALELHDRVLREALVELAGYEVKTDGDAFMVVFKSASVGVRWALVVQERLMASEWPPDLLGESEAAPASAANGTPLFRGLRVRMGIHVGSVESRPNPLTGRMDYFGPTVNRAARIADAAHGGQVLVTEEVAAEIAPRLSELGDPSLEVLGSYELKGFDEPAAVLQLLPLSLAERRFKRPRGVVAR